MRIKESFEKSSNIYEKLIYVARNTKVVKGGRRFSFSALVVVGGRNGSFGFGRGKARDVAAAIQKASERARKVRINVCVKSLTTIPYMMTSRLGATKVIILPAYQGTSVVAGSVLRSIFYVAGVENVLTKVIGSRNSNNIVLAVVKCFKSMRSIDTISCSRGMNSKNVFSI
jgi:small subunit ribosomal protein S5